MHSKVKTIWKHKSGQKVALKTVANEYTIVAVFWKTIVIVLDLLRCTRTDNLSIDWLDTTVDHEPPPPSCYFFGKLECLIYGDHNCGARRAPRLPQGDYWHHPEGWQSWSQPDHTLHICTVKYVKSSLRFPWCNRVTIMEIELWLSRSWESSLFFFTFDRRVRTLLGVWELLQRRHVGKAHSVRDAYLAIADLLDVGPTRKERLSSHFSYEIPLNIPGTCCQLE